MSFSRTSPNTLAGAAGAKGIPGAVVAGAPGVAPGTVRIRTSVRKRTFSLTSQKRPKIVAEKLELFFAAHDEIPYVPQ